MKVNFDKDSEHYRFFREFYKFTCKYAEPEQSDEFWNEVTSEANELTEKYNNNYYRYLVIVHLEMLQRKFEYCNTGRTE